MVCANDVYNINCKFFYISHEHSGYQNYFHMFTYQHLYQVWNRFDIWLTCILCFDTVG